MLNDKAIHILACALSDKELNQVSHLESAKEMWEALEIAHGESIDEASSEGECSNEEERNRSCLVAEIEEATSSDSDSDNEVYDSEPTYDELLSEYNNMHSEYIKLAKELVKAKKKINGLEEKLNKTPDAIHCDKCIESENKSIELKKIIDKFTRSSEMLNVILGSQRCFFDKSGLGYVPKKDGRKKKIRGEKSYLNFFRNSAYSSSPFTHCSYCNRKGHSTSSCYHKKKGTYGTFKWVPKGTFVPKANVTNRSGPKKKWVPKYPSISTSLQDISKNGRIDQKMPKQKNQKINLKKAREAVPHISKLNHKRNRLRQEPCTTSMKSYNKVPFSYRRWNTGERTSQALRKSWSIPHVSKSDHKRNPWKQRVAHASKMSYHRVPFIYRKRQKEYWVW